MKVKEKHFIVFLHFTIRVDNTVRITSDVIWCIEYMFHYIGFPYYYSYVVPVLLKMML